MQKLAGLLVGAVLPRNARIGEVELYPAVGDEVGVIREFLAAIKGDSTPRLRRQPRDRLHGGLAIVAASLPARADPPFVPGTNP
ncbi:hypothetical protein M2284_003388 [Rhodococcus sp. LBL1]|nr:hypothetical protein [Rhodococcus sp. LBL1]MDH6685088.1 hypothetical protein [Rhodococcus sp. LBL2]